MLKGAVASRYAEALYEIATREKAVDQIEQELKALEAILDENDDLKKVLFHPQITAVDKKDFLQKLFGGKVAEVTMNFLALVVDRRREVFFADIVAEFVKMANASRNIVAAQVTSAVELNDKEKKEFDRLLAKLTGKKVQTSFGVDPSLIGGVVVRIGDKIIDGSIRTRLSAMKERLKAIS